MVYLIHFSTPYKHARHYIGYTDCLAARLRHHRAGTGSRLMKAVTEAGIGWKVARKWPEGTRTFERQLKDRHKASQLCPTCRREAKRGRNGSDRREVSRHAG